MVSMHNARHNTNFNKFSKWFQALCKCLIVSAVHVKLAGPDDSGRIFLEYFVCGPARIKLVIILLLVVVCCVKFVNAGHDASMLTVVSFIGLQLHFGNATALIRKHPSMYEKGPNFAKFVLFGHEISSTSNNPSTTTNSSHTNLICINLVLLWMLYNMTDHIGKVLLPSRAFNFWTVSKVHTHNNAIQIDASD